MIIALYNVDSKIPNLPLMKISAYYKQKGDYVTWYSPIFYNTYDKIFASKVFTNTPAPYLRKKMIKGGTGFNIKKELPPEIEHIYPDYGLYGIDYAMGFITRGCIRACKFCVVPQKEGNIRLNASLSEFCKDQKRVMLLDNNFLAYKDHIYELEQLAATKKTFDFNQGLDIRLINQQNAAILAEMKLETIGGRPQIRFALDDPGLIPVVEKKLKIFKNAGIRLTKLVFYVLVGFNTTLREDLLRVNFLQKHGITPFAMNYNNQNGETRDFCRWVNRFRYKYESFRQYLSQKSK